MKLFFKILNSGDLNDIGYYPQTDFKKGYNPNLPNSIWKIKPNEFPNFILNYELELHEAAILTNCIDGIGNSGIIVDYKLKTILEDFSLPKHQFYPIKVFQKGKQLEYYYFHFIFNLLEFLDVDSSTFRVENSSNKMNYITIPFLSDNNSLNKLINYYLMEIDYILKPNKLVLNSKFPNYDLFSNIPVGIDTIISKRLKKSLDSNNISGLDYKLIKYFY